MVAFLRSPSWTWKEGTRPGGFTSAAINSATRARSRIRDPTRSANPSSTVAGDPWNEWQWCEWILGNQFTEFLRYQVRILLCSVLAQRCVYKIVLFHFSWPLGILAGCWWCLGIQASLRTQATVGFRGLRFVDRWVVVLMAEIRLTSWGW